MKLNCTECGLPMHPKTIGEEFPRYVGTEKGSRIMEFETLVGYFSEPPHVHNDNCLKRLYICANCHSQVVSLWRSCPACDWKGKTDCFCHNGEKVEEWPE